MQGRHVLATILLVIDSMFILVPHLKDTVATIPFGSSLIVVIGILSLIVAFILLKDDAPAHKTAAFVPNKR